MMLEVVDLAYLDLPVEEARRRKGFVSSFMDFFNTKKAEV